MKKNNSLILLALAGLAIWWFGKRAVSPVIPTQPVTVGLDPARTPVTWPWQGPGYPIMFQMIQPGGGTEYFPEYRIVEMQDQGWEVVYV